MTVDELEKRAREIWGDKPMSLQDIVVTMGVVYGDICRQARMKAENGEVNDEELKKELGNLIFSVIRWCKDLGYDPEECINLAKAAQLRYRPKPTP